MKVHEVHKWFTVVQSRFRALLKKLCKSRTSNRLNHRFSSTLTLLRTANGCEFRCALGPKGVRACALGVGRAAAAISQAEGGLPRVGRTDLLKELRLRPAKTPNLPVPHLCECVYSSVFLSVLFVGVFVCSPHDTTMPPKPKSQLTKVVPARRLPY